jgi:DNA-binding ferritin-like protein (Dps family)
MPESVEQLKGYKSQDAQPPTDVLEQSLLDAACGFSATYVILDALDECPKLNGERAELMKSLSRILTATMATATSNLHLFCTSRKEVDINIGFSAHLSRSEAAEIDLSSCKQEVEQDISQFIDSTLSSADFNSWSQKIRAEVKEELVKKSDGM